MNDSLETSPDDASKKTSTPLHPPRHWYGMIRFAGPGLIVAGSIVGSGELIATTKAGAVAGFALLWLIVLGCVVKVFTQVELGRYTLISGRTTLDALTEVPGPRWKGRGNWLVWYWFLMWFASIGQLGGIVGGVGQAMAISVPVTQMGRDYNALADARVKQQIQRTLSRTRETTSSDGEVVISGLEVDADVEQLQREYEARYVERVDGEPVMVDGKPLLRSPADVAIWASLIAAFTSVLLVVGRYSLIQRLSTVLVCSFTVLVIANLMALQRNVDFSFSFAELLSGFTFATTDDSGSESPRMAIRTALAAFGIIGVGAAELVTYPYWCLERGYARFTGPNDHSAAWIERARGWMRVMRFDAWGAMVIYTFSTIAFYLLGASVLHRVGLNPEKADMVRTLAIMFVPVFSDWAATIFLFGAFAVLYSTFFVANASHARVFTDGLRVIGFIADDAATRERWIRRLSGFFPVLCVFIFVLFPSPAQLVLLSGVAQGIMLPMLAVAALFFRYRRGMPGMQPGSWWDAFLWLSAAAMLLTGTWTIYSEMSAYFQLTPN